MASQVTARQFIPLKHLSPPTDSLHKMHRKQHEGILKRMYMPFVRGPEDRHYFASFQDKHSNAFLKTNPYISPEEKSYPLVPHRDDVPVINTFSGFLSPGAAAESDQQIKYHKTSGPLGDGQDVQQHPRWAPVQPESSQIAYRRPSLSLDQRHQSRRWNSRAVPDIYHRARIGGWTSPVKVTPAAPQVKECFSPHTFVFNVHSDIKSSDPSEASRDEKARKYMYTSTTQRAYEEVPWDRMLPPKVQPADSTLERMADYVSQCFTIKPYEPAPEISQVVGGLWDRFQKRSFTSPHKPINFVSPSSRTQHLPLYTGRVGAENIEDLDNPYVDLITHGNVRTTKPRYVKSSYLKPFLPTGVYTQQELNVYTCGLGGNKYGEDEEITHFFLAHSKPNTFGYTGKVHWSATQPANSNLPPTSPSIISQMHGYIARHGQPTEFPHLGPLSQVLTPTEPQNSFNKKEKERIKI